MIGTCLGMGKCSALGWGTVWGVRAKPDLSKLKRNKKKWVNANMLSLPVKAKPIKHNFSLSQHFCCCSKEFRYCSHDRKAGNEKSNWEAKSYESGGDPGALRLVASILGLSKRSYVEGSVPLGMSWGRGPPLVSTDTFRPGSSMTTSSGSMPGVQGTRAARRLFILRYLQRKQMRLWLLSKFVV